MVKFVFSSHQERCCIKTAVVNQGAELKLLCLTKKIREILAITRLVTVFQVYDSETETIASFA